MRLKWRFVAAALVLAAPTAQALASSCTSLIWPQSSVNQIDSNLRERIIRAKLSEGRSSTRTWTMSWGLGWATVTLGQSIAALGAKDASKTDLWVGAASSSLGLIPTWIAPPAMATEEVPKPDGSCDSLSKFETLLNSYANTDHLNTSWKSHTSNVAVNIAVALILGLGYGHWNAAALSLGAGIPIGEFMILTYPGSAEKFREHYIAGDISEKDLAENTAEKNLWERTRITAMPQSVGGSLTLALDF